MKLKRFELALAVSLVLAVLTGFFLEGQSQALSGQLVRLHVLANSDTAEDQALKLTVRDAVLDYAEPLLTDVGDPAEARRILEEHLPEIETAALQTMREQGYDYPAAVSLQKTFFSTREYDGFSLPQGEYEALRVVLGEGGGQNWWCVVFPPLCAAATRDTFSQTALQNGLKEGQISLITEEEPVYVFEFKCLELWAGIKKFLFG